MVKVPFPVPRCAYTVATGEPSFFEQRTANGNGVSIPGWEQLFLN